MTMLQIMPDDEPRNIIIRTRDDVSIAKELAKVGVVIARWDSIRVSSDADKDAILAAYSEEVSELCEKNGCRLVDIVGIHTDEREECPAAAVEARSKFLEEHRHSEDEVRFFVSGRGCFYLHVNHRVYALVCEAGDLLAVPADTRHWFDMGSHPNFVSIRFFEEDDGWIGNFTGDPIASSFPRLDELLAMTP